MKYLFTKNQASDIEDTVFSLTQAIRTYDKKVLNPHDTRVSDFMAAMAIPLTILVGGVIASSAIVMLIGLFLIIIPASLVTDIFTGHGIVGEKMNARYLEQNPELLKMKNKLTYIRDRLDEIEMIICMSNDLERMYDRYGENMKIEITNIDKDDYDSYEDEYRCKVVFTGSIEKTIGDQLSYSDKTSEDYRIDKDIAARIFLGEVVDFSWLDGEIEDVKSDLDKTLQNIAACDRALLTTGAFKEISLDNSDTDTTEPLLLPVKKN